ncbi:nociceptin receptor-like [Strongylocentrotus purpuratus]|uniref:G-protein coupled receptors family 1 profile domain-containing protein n=1 Tax=Strongylocentrotus purpuratus TaxID=7668 RepID=A0A7M7NZY2_STRPU|nr:nociceptin receptor-like [Strongylocentrotus purpuratus]
MNGTNISDESEWEWAPFMWTWWVIVQLVLSITGMVGNLLVIAVIVRRRRPVQFTANVLIGSLSVADFLTSFWMIPRPSFITVPPNWKGMLYCRIEYSNILMWISVVASVFILTVISVERLVAVKYPFRFRFLFTVKRSVRLVGMSWLGSAILNLYILTISSHDSMHYTCVTKFPTRGVHVTAGVLLFMFEYLIPVSIMTGSHFAIIRELHALARSFQVNGHVPPPSLKLLQTKQRMTRTVLIVVVTYIVCWSPDQICFFLFNLDLYRTFLYSDLYRIFVCLAFVYSCSNPIIYSVRNKKFRTALFEFLCVSPSKKKKASLDKNFSSLKQLTLRQNTFGPR